MNNPTLEVRDRLDSSVLVTDEMVGAGLAVLGVWAEYERNSVSERQILKEIYVAMSATAFHRGGANVHKPFGPGVYRVLRGPPKPGDVQKIETVVISEPSAA